MTSTELRRYTDFTAVMRMLRLKQITLLSPSKWEDENDRNLMEAYRRSTDSKCVLALCFAQSKETYHHWKVFADSKSGVCIRFDKARLVEVVQSQDVLVDEVSYKTLPDITFGTLPPPHKLPFLKRSAFSDEREIRFIWKSMTECISYKDFDFPISAVKSISINPWAPEPLVDEMKLYLKSLLKNSEIRVYQTKLLNSGNWRNLADIYKMKC